MNDNDLLLLSAYLDNELELEQCSEFEQRLQQDNHLRECLGQLRHNDRVLKQAFSAIVDTPLPSELERLLTQDKSVESDSKSYFAQWVSTFFTGLVTGRPVWSAALAVLVVVIVGGYMGKLPITHTPDTVLATEVPIPSSSSLAGVLSSVTSGTTTTVNSNTITMELSFIHKDNSLCRQYTLRNMHEQLQGIACKKGIAWVKVLTSSANSQVDSYTHYRLAESDRHVIGSYITEYIQGIPLTPQEENQYLRGNTMNDWEQLQSIKR